MRGRTLIPSALHSWPPARRPPDPYTPICAAHRPRAALRCAANSALFARRAYSDSLAAVRASLAAPLAPDTLRTSTHALRTDLAERGGAAAAPAAADAAALYARAAASLAADNRVAESAFVLRQLAVLGATCERPLVIDVLRHAEHPAALWDAVSAVLPSPLVSREYAPVVRRCVRDGHVGRAASLLSEAIRYGTRSTLPSRAVVHTVMIEMKIVRRVLAQHSPGPLKRAPGLFSEYADALEVLGALLAENYLPLVADEKESLAWLVKHLYCFGEVAAACRDLAPGAQVDSAAARIAAVLPDVVAHLPDGAPAPPTALWSCREDRQRYLCKPLGAQTYSALVHYTLTYANRPSWCRQVLEHMARIRSPPLALSRVAVNTLVQQATRRRLGDLATYALELDASSTGPNRESTAQARLLVRLDDAVHAGDTYRIAALLQYIATLRLRLRRDSRGAVRPTSVLYRLYPELRSLALWRSHDVPSPPAAVYHPRVLTAALHVTLAAGNVPLALRLWSILKLAAHQSAAQRQWHVPVQAATLLFDLLGRSARRRTPGSARAAVVALHEYEWLIEHWVGTQESLDARFFRSLLRVLRTDAHSRALMLRIRRDMAALDIA